MRRVQIFYKAGMGRNCEQQVKRGYEAHDYFAVRTGAVCSMTGSSTLIEGRW